MSLDGLLSCGQPSLGCSGRRLHISHSLRTSGSQIRIVTVRSFKERLPMSTKIYVGNLPFSVTNASLKSNFAEFGDVTSARVMMDRDTGTSKGFGFVEMASAEVAQAAIKALHGLSVDGRSIVVSLARPREASAGSSDRGGAAGYRASNRADVGYGTGGFGGGRY